MTEAALLHCRFGIYRYSDELYRHGILTPSRQICATAWFVDNRLLHATHLPPVSDPEAGSRWMRAELSSSLDQLRQVMRLEPLETLQSRLGELVQWNVYRDFAELLHYRCGAEVYLKTEMRLRASCARSIDLTALPEQFVLTVLPQAVRRFNPAIGDGREPAWLSTVFYRFALLSTLSILADSESLSAFSRDLTALDPETVLIEKENSIKLRRIHQTLRTLPERQRAAVEMYFGFQGDEHTLQLIADRLNCSPYIARNYLVSALAMIAVRSDIETPLLTPNDRELLRLLFVDGLGLTTAAKKLGITEQAARSRAGGVSEKFRVGLRAHTRKAQYQSGYTPMNTETNISPEPVVSLRDALKQLRGVPPLRIHQGCLQALLAGTWYDTAEVRDASDYETRVRFLKAGIPLGWIGVAAGPEEDPGESIVAELQRRSGLVAMALLIRCREIAIQREIATVFAASSAGATDVAGCIHSVLGSLSVAIEGTLPETDYASAELREFVLVRDRDMRLVGRWRRSDIVIDVSRVLLDRARWVGKFSSVESSVIEEVIGEEIFGDFELLPGFTRLPSDQEDSATFALLPASIEAIWAMRQVIDRNVGPEPAATFERTPPLGIKTA